VSSPAEAHQNQVSYQLNNEQVEVIGFFSTEHKAVFTHHDSFLHMHLLTADKSKIGHLDEALFGKGIKLYLPVE
jgi:acetolactate decarboxylase